LVKIKGIYPGFYPIIPLKISYGEGLHPLTEVFIDTISKNKGIIVGLDNPLNIQNF